jgi:hypothetical protein
MLKPIDLTPAQRDKLLEMCRSLFPEQGWYCLAERQPWNLISYGLIRTTPTKELDDVYTFHWFELTITHLSKAVAIQYGKLPYSSNTWATHMIKSIMCDSKKHPVDQLYDIWMHPHIYSQEL